VTGGIIGGLLLGLGMNLIVQGVNIGWLITVPAAPLSAVIGWLMARRLAAKLPK
jgi:hypothetical protein